MSRFWMVFCIGMIIGCLSMSVIFLESIYKILKEIKSKIDK